MIVHTRFRLEDGVVENSRPHQSHRQRKGPSSSSSSLGATGRRGLHAFHSVVEGGSHAEELSKSVEVRGELLLTVTVSFVSWQ